LVRVASETLVPYVEKVLVPLAPMAVQDIQGDADRMRDKLGTYPLYAFLLYTEMDEDLVAFLRRAYWLHTLSGSDCLVSVFENPTNWGEQWKKYWQEKLGPDFNRMSRDWYKLQPLDRDSAFSLADRLGVDKNALPCIVFLESFGDRRIMCLPIVADRVKYREYFQSLFAAVSRAAKAPPGNRLDALHGEWRKVWVKLILPEKAKGLAKSIQDWGSVISDTKDAIVNLLNPVSPLINSILRPAQGGPH
jgi:hypothetical protein